MSAKISFTTMMSLDGYFETPDGKINWVPIDEEIHRHANQEAEKVDLFVFGRRLYETMRYWDGAENAPGRAEVEHQFAALWKRKPKLVVSKTLSATGPNAKLLKGDFLTELTRLKAETSGFIEVGGPELAAQAMAAGLIDIFQLYVFPLLLGDGIAVFKAPAPFSQLHLTETHTFKSGTLGVRYERVAR